MDVFGLKPHYEDTFLARGAAGMGHNRPPTLAEELATETASLAERAHEMVVCADERCEIIDDETAAKSVQLIGQMKDMIAEIETARVERKEPFLSNGRTVDQHFHTILEPLGGADHKKKLGGAAGDLLARIDAYRRQKEFAVEAERRRIEAEVRKAHEEAAAAAALVQTPGISAEEFDRADLARRRAEDEEAKLSAQAAATVARPIDSGVGPKTSTRKNYTVTITNLAEAVAHCMEIDRDGLIVYVLSVYNRQVRARVRSLPGAKLTEDTSTGIRRK